MSAGQSRPYSSETAFYYTHVGSAISELRTALANPGYMSITSIMRTVLNLGWAAHMVEDPASAEIHVSGMVSLQGEISSLPCAPPQKHPSVNV